MRSALLSGPSKERTNGEPLPCLPPFVPPSLPRSIERTDGRSNYCSLHTISSPPILRVICQEQRALIHFGTNYQCGRDKVAKSRWRKEARVNPVVVSCRLSLIRSPPFIFSMTQTSPRTKIRIIDFTFINHAGDSRAAAQASARVGWVRLMTLFLSPGSALGPCSNVTHISRAVARVRVHHGDGVYVRVHT